MQLSIDEDKWINYYIIVINLESKLKDRFKHCVNSVRIRSYSGPHFLAFGLNTERYFASLHIQSKCKENADQNNSKYGHFSRSESTYK